MMLITYSTFYSLITPATAASDNTPLRPTEATALRAFYTSMNCNNQTACPMVANNTVCPPMPALEWSEGLKCERGTVREISIYGNVDLRNAVFPSDMSGFSQLSLLYVFGHRGDLRGTFPSALLRLSNLQMIDLADNELSGTIPTELGLSTVITHLSIHFNKFSGTIPTQLSGLSQLVLARFYSNQLHGVAPRFPNSTDCRLTQSGDTNCFSMCLSPQCCRSTRFCPDPTTKPTTTTPPPTTTTTTTTTTTMTNPTTTSTTPSSTATTASPPIVNTIVATTESAALVTTDLTDANSSIALNGTTAFNGTTVLNGTTSVASNPAAVDGTVDSDSKLDTTLIAGVVGGIVGFLFLLLLVLGAILLAGRRQSSSTSIQVDDHKRTPRNVYQPMPDWDLVDHRQNSLNSGLRANVTAVSNVRPMYGDVPKASNVSNFYDNLKLRTSENELN